MPVFVGPQTSVMDIEEALDAAFRSVFPKFVGGFFEPEEKSEYNHAPETVRKAQDLVNTVDAIRKEQIVSWRAAAEAAGVKPEKLYNARKILAKVGAQ